MQFNQKLVNQLAAGEIALDACLNKEMAESILKETGLPVRNEHKHRYYYRNAFGTIVNNGVHYELKSVPISDFILPENRTIIEFQTFFGSEKQFEIGKCYEFSDDNEEWSKGKLLAIVDHRDKYVVGFEDVVFGFEFIRPIQPKEVTRWINMSQSGNQVGKKCFESEMEACQHAPQSQKVFQVKLTGTYTI